MKPNRDPPPRPGASKGKNDKKAGEVDVTTFILGDGRMPESAHARLERLAKGATQGPWRVGKSLPMESLQPYDVVATLEDGAPYVVLAGNINFPEDARANAAFVAAANPEMVLALLAENERFLARIKELTEQSNELYGKLKASEQDSTQLRASLDRADTQIKTLLSDPGSYQSGYNRGRHDMYNQRLAELELLQGQRDEALERIKLLGWIHGDKASVILDELKSLRQQLAEVKKQEAAPKQPSDGCQHD